ncbi:MAG: polyphosphate polymerase domain-containing protein [Clostridia bacterium]|nr:polyphosphate polymerase domain-containing protein [Clostridia bacterium]
MSNEVFNRKEEKYIVTDSLYKNILTDLHNKMKADEYSKNNSFYQICNIYYDTEDNNLIRTSLQKPKYKEKIRLRSYGTPDKNTKVFLEIKKKYKGCVNKRRTTFYLNDAYKFAVTGDIPPLEDYMNLQIMKELSYAVKTYSLVPKVYLSYQRAAFFSVSDSNFRLTFDKNIIARRDDLALEYGVFGERVIPEGQMIMEVKYCNRIPLWFTEILRKYNLTKTSFSKYGTEYTNFLLKEYGEVKKYA